MTNPTRYGTSCAPREDGVFVHFSEYEKVVTECERLRADAERFQWLKAHWGHRTPILNGLFPRGAVDDAFDAGIDAARAKEAT